MEDVSVFILVGGRSSRMGTDKALLLFGGESLLQLTLRKAKAVSSEPVIVGERARYAAFGKVVEDKYPGCGPLSGIHAALSATETDLNLILSVDMPLMTSDFLLWLASRARAGTELVTVPECDGASQPLCAVYRRASLPAVENGLTTGEFKVGRIFHRVPTRHVTDSEIRSAGFRTEIFCNVNTPEELEAATGQAPRVPLERAKG